MLLIIGCTNTSSGDPLKYFQSRVLSSKFSNESFNLSGVCKFSLPLTDLRVSSRPGREFLCLKIYSMYCRCQTSPLHSMYYLLYPRLQTLCGGRPIPVPCQSIVILSAWYANQPWASFFQFDQCHLTLYLQFYTMQTWEPLNLGALDLPILKALFAVTSLGRYSVGINQQVSVIQFNLSI